MANLWQTPLGLKREGMAIENWPFALWGLNLAFENETKEPCVKPHCPKKREVRACLKNVLFGGLAQNLEMENQPPRPMLLCWFGQQLKKVCPCLGLLWLMMTM